MIKNSAELIGWHIGDGCISQLSDGRMEYTLTGDLVEEIEFYENVVIPQFNSLFKNKLGKQITLKKYLSVGVCGIYLFDKKFIKHIQTKYKLPIGKKVNVEIPKIIRDSSDLEVKKAFLRGLFDTDGSIYFCKSNSFTKQPSLYRLFHYKPKIKLATISKNLIEQVKFLLLSIGIYARVQKPIKQRFNENTVYSVVIDRFGDVTKWLEIVGFKNPKHITKIRIWTQFGFCPPYTRLIERENMLKNEIYPFEYYFKNF